MSEEVRVPVPPADRTRALKIKEIFHSLQGETRTTGLPTVFVRLTGCPLRCTYCDTEYAFTGGQWMDFDAILAQVAGHGAKYVTVTGGEPLAQPRCLDLLTELCDAGYEVSLETSGAIDVAAVDQRVVKVLDLKTPDSGEQARNLWSNLEHIDAKDQIKFVICSRADYEWSLNAIRRERLEDRCEVLISPIHGELKPAELAEWMLQDRLQARFQLQLHKYLWGDEPGR